jgi:hypothetical protein
MSTSLKLLIPLAIDPTPLQLLSKEAGFIDAYTHDLNKPFLENKIFLMYEADFNTTEKAERFEFFCRLNIPFYTYKIGGKKRLVYYFDIKTKSIMNPKASSVCTIYHDDERHKIISFWENKDKDVNEYMYEQKKPVFYEENIIPIEDYDENQHYKGLTIKKAATL